MRIKHEDVCALLMGVLDGEEHVDAWLSPSKQPLQLARDKTKVMFSILLSAYLCNKSLKPFRWIGI